MIQRNDEKYMLSIICATLFFLNKKLFFTMLLVVSILNIYVLVSILVKASGKETLKRNISSMEINGPVESQNCWQG
jgi:hypothetical protein